MPIIDFDAMPKMAITEKHSDAFGELLTGSTIEVGRLHFKAGSFWLWSRRALRRRSIALNLSLL